MKKSTRTISKVMIAALLVCVLSLAIVLTACNKKGAINMDNPMVFSALKPGSYEVSYDKDGNVEIFLRLLGDLGLDETVLIRHDQT